MVNILFCITILGILILLGCVFYFFLSKLPKNGNTTVKWKIALYKFLQIEFESEHTNNSTK